MGVQASCFDTFKSFSHHDLTTKHGYFGCSRLSDVDGIKIFDKDDQAAKHCSGHPNVLQLGHLIKKFDSTNIRRP